MTNNKPTPSVAIGCGGTGGHLFPGLAVAHELRKLGCSATLIISAKEVDREASREAGDHEIFTLPAIGLRRGGEIQFAQAFVRSFRMAGELFRTRVPDAALAMGGFTSAPPLLAARRHGALTFLHESNSVPGRANRWLSWTVNRAFISFPSAAARLHTRNPAITGTPVRPQFRPMEPAACRAELGLDPQRPVLLIMGGSQGAGAINSLLIEGLAHFRKAVPALQFLHVTGTSDHDKVRAVYGNATDARVFSFTSQMHQLLGAASVAICRAGASSLAELAAMRVPAVLIPFPSATDNHQFLNALAYVESGAAEMIEQSDATPQSVSECVGRILTETERREALRRGLARWHEPAAAETIAHLVLEAVASRRASRKRHPVQTSSSLPAMA